jgi:hypothetical protein
MGPMVAMDGAAMSVMTGGSGVLALAWLMYWVTRRMQPMGSVRKTSRRAFRGVRVVRFRAMSL